MVTELVWAHITESSQGFEIEFFALNSLTESLLILSRECRSILPRLNHSPAEAAEYPIDTLKI